MTAELTAARAWAQCRLNAMQEPPWAQVQYEQLIRVIDEILAAQSATITLEDSLRSERSRDSVPPRAANIFDIDSARPHRLVQPVRLPM